MVALLVERGVPDPLTSAYVLANFVIGSATTAPMARSEAATAIDERSAPLYARLHAEHPVNPEVIVAAGLGILLAGLDPVA